MLHYLLSWRRNLSSSLKISFCAHMLSSLSTLKQYVLPFDHTVQSLKQACCFAKLEILQLWLQNLLTRLICLAEPVGPCVPTLSLYSGTYYIEVFHWNKLFLNNRASKRSNNVRIFQELSMTTIHRETGYNATYLTRTKSKF